MLGGQPLHWRVLRYGSLPELLLWCSKVNLTPPPVGNKIAFLVFKGSLRDRFKAHGCSETCCCHYRLFVCYCWFIGGCHRRCLSMLPLMFAVGVPMPSPPVGCMSLPTPSSPTQLPTPSSCSPIGRSFRIPTLFFYFASLFPHGRSFLKFCEFYSLLAGSFFVKSR